MKKSNSNSNAIVVFVIVIAVIWVAAIVCYSSRMFLWFSNNENGFESLIDDIRIMKAYPIEKIHYQDGKFFVQQLRYDYQTDEYYIDSSAYDESDLVSEKGILIDYDEYKKKEEEAKRNIADDINSIKNRIWTGDKHLLSCIYACWDKNGKILVHIRIAQKELRNTEKVLAYSYVYIEDGFSDGSVEPTGRLKKLKENWYLEEAKVDVG